MAIVKYAELAILETEMGQAGVALQKRAHRHTFTYEPKPGFLYVRSRAISSRCNDNFDEFPAPEIKAAWASFIGRPVFVNHKNDNHKRARGVIIDAALHEDVNPDGSPDTWVEVLMEVDAIRFPKLAKAILAGDIERTSMGTDVEYSVCSACGNKARTPLEYCAHIPKMKGKRIRRFTASGSTEEVLVREICLTPDTPILMGDGSETAISLIGVGETVADHLGEPRRVTGIMSREVDEELVVIERVGFWKPVRITHNHPVLVLRRSDAANGQRKWMAARLESGKIAPEFIEAAEVQPGDFVAEVVPRATESLRKIAIQDWVVPDLASHRDHPSEAVPDRFYVPERAWRGRPHILRACRSCGAEMDLYPSEASRLYCSSKCWGDGYARGNTSHGGRTSTPIGDTVEMDREFGRWCGWFLAEGSVTYQQGRRHPRGVCFALHISEHEHANEIAQLGWDLFGLAASHGVRGNGRTVEFFNADLARFMRCLGDDCYTKALPDEWLSAPIEFISGVVTAHHDGDGEHGGGRSGGTQDPQVMTHATSSPRLADQLHTLHLMLGHTPTRKKPDPAGGSSKRTVPGHHVRARLDGDAQKRFSWGPWVFSPVRSVGREAYVGTVHNLEVEGTHTYVANHMAVHNCHGLNFFENSLLVEDPADPTAYFLGVDASGLSMAASSTQVASTASTAVLRPLVATASQKTADAKRLYVHQLVPGDSVNLGGSMRGWVVERIEDEGEHRRLFFAPSYGTPERGLALRLDEAVSVNNPGRRRPVPDTPYVPRDPNEAYKANCPACGKYVTIRNQKWVSHNWNNDRCPASGQSDDWSYLDYARSKGWTAMNGTASKTAFGEPKAPAEVNTLREATCPVCGEEDTFDGDKCMVCGYMKPPDQFMDPDLDKAKEVDLRQKQEQADGDGSVTLTCDSCGASVKGHIPASPKEARRTAAGPPRIPEKFVLKKRKDDGEVSPDEDKPADETEQKNGEEADPKPDDSATTEEEIKGEDGAEPDRSLPTSEDPATSGELETSLPQPGDQCPECGKGTLQAPEGGDKANDKPEEFGGQPKAKEPPQEAPGPAKTDEKPKDDAAEESGDSKPKDDKKDEGEDKDDDEDEDKKTKKPWPPKGDGKTGAHVAPQQKDQMMRPTLRALAEQQILLDATNAKIARIAQLAGIDLSDIDAASSRRVASLRRQAAGEEPPVETAAENWPISSPSDPPFNPPSPPATAPSATTEEAVTPDATVDLMSGGATLTETGPDATTDLMAQSRRRRRLAEVLPPETPESVDVTAPVAGTEAPPADAQILEDIRTGEPADNTPMADENPNWTGTTGSKTYAALRLARLRIQAEIADGTDDLVEAMAIEAKMDLPTIEKEISTLSKVMERSASRQQPVRPVESNGGGGGPRRSAPSIATIVNTASRGSGATQPGSGLDSALFE